jgi:hypothetical protein
LDRPKARAFTSRGNADPGGPALMVFARMAVAVLAQAWSPPHIRCTRARRKVAVRLVQYAYVMISKSSSDCYPNVIDGIVAGPSAAAHRFRTAAHASDASFENDEVSTTARRSAMRFPSLYNALK